MLEDNLNLVGFYNENPLHKNNMASVICFYQSLYTSVKVLIQVFEGFFLGLDLFIS